MTGTTRILLIDDDQVDRASVRRALAKSGLAHELAEAPSGMAGLDMARARSFDCVLLDYRLPDVDTFELLPKLLAPEGGEQAVLMLTGEADQDIAMRLMRTGALDYLAKHEVTPSSLARAIRYATARREFVAELAAARREAEEKSLALDTLNRQKTLLFSIVAHDLRNPFQVILGLSSVLSRAVAAKDHASIERRAQGIGEAAGQAHALMESLFAWASVQMDTLAVTMGAVGLSEVVTEIIGGAAQTASDKGITLCASDVDLEVKANRDMLATVLRNLVSNAVKFTLPGGDGDPAARAPATSRSASATPASACRPARPTICSGSIGARRPTAPPASAAAGSGCCSAVICLSGRRPGSRCGASSVKERFSGST